MIRTNGVIERVRVLLLAALGTASCSGNTADVGGEDETDSITSDSTGSGGSNSSGSGGSSDSGSSATTAGGSNSGSSATTAGGGGNDSGNQSSSSLSTSSTGFAYPSCDDLGDALDSRWIVFDSDAGKLERRIYAVEAKEGATPQPLTPKSVLAREPAVSPDGSELAYVVDSGIIRILNLASGEEEDVILGDQPAWFPDGKSFAYHTGDGVRRFYLEDKRSDELVNCDSCSLGGFQNPEFSRDGDFIVMDRENQIDLFDIADGSSHQVVMNWTTTMTHPTLSPNADWLVAAIMCDGPVFSLWLHEAGLTTIPCEGRRLAYQGANPAWGPESIIAYELGEEARDVALLDIDTNTTCVLEHEGEDRNPTWAPEGFEPPSND